MRSIHANVGLYCPRSTRVICERSQGTRHASISCVYPCLTRRSRRARPMARRSSTSFDGRVLMVTDQSSLHHGTMCRRDYTPQAVRQPAEAQNIPSPPPSCEAFRSLPADSECNAASVHPKHGHACLFRQFTFAVSHGKIRSQKKLQGYLDRDVIPVTKSIPILRAPVPK